MESAKYLKVQARVRYWDDATINGECSETSENVPFVDGEIWCPVIDIHKGVIVDWPEGTEAFFHFKVCDAGEYFLLDEFKAVIASRLDNYVPDGLCHNDTGYGDYIIFGVNKDGSIKNYSNSIDFDQFEI